jgi:hypothetical protein
VPYSLTALEDSKINDWCIPCLPNLSNQLVAFISTWPTRAKALAARRTRSPATSCVAATARARHGTLASGHGERRACGHNATNCYRFCRARGHNRLVVPRRRTRAPVRRLRRAGFIFNQ